LHEVDDPTVDIRLDVVDDGAHRDDAQRSLAVGSDDIARTAPVPGHVERPGSTGGGRGRRR
jgi:hypothetical protein